MTGPFAPSAWIGRVAVTGDVLTGLAPDLQRIRAVAHRDVQQAIRTLERNPIEDPVVLATLRAELLLGSGQRAVAIQEAARAARLAEGGPLEIRATAVYADIACTTGNPHDAIQVCEQFRDLTLDQLTMIQSQDRHHLSGTTAAVEPPPRSEAGAAVDRGSPWIRLARILTAVAAYHSDCDAGRARLQRTHRAEKRLNATPALVTALAAGLKTMDAWCTPPPCGPAILTRPLRPVPGGLLQLDPATINARWLTDRIRAKACAGTHPSGSADTGAAASTGNPT